MSRKLLAVAVVVIAAAGCGSTARSGVDTTHSSHAARARLTRICTLPQAISKASAAALPGGRLMILGGYTGSTSVDTIVAGKPNDLVQVGHLPQTVHDAAAVYLRGSVYLFGGGSSVSTPSVVKVSTTGKAKEAPALDEPLSDLGAVTIDNRAFLVGGYTGTSFASAILRYLPSGGTATMTRLPHGTRYAGVTAIGGTIYVAGGLTTAGMSNAIYAISNFHLRKIGTLPHGEDHAALAALDGTLYLAGGRQVLAISPQTGKVRVAAKLPSSLSDPTATTVGNEIVIAGGGTNGVWAFRP